MKSTNMFVILLVIAVLFGMCACDITPAESTTPIKIEPAETEPAVVTPYLEVDPSAAAYGTTPIDLRLEIIGNDGNVQEVTLSALAVPYPNDWSEPLVNNIFIGDFSVNSIKIASEDVTICRVNTPGPTFMASAGWTTVPFDHYQEWIGHTDITFQLIIHNEDTSNTVLHDEKCDMNNMADSLYITLAFD